MPLLHLKEAITIDSVSDHDFTSKRGDERKCAKCGEYWKSCSHHRTFDKSKKGKEALFFDEFINNELDIHIKKYSRNQAE